MKQSSKKTKLQVIIIFLLSLTVILACQLRQLLIPAVTPTSASTVTIKATHTFTATIASFTLTPTPIGGGLIAFINPKTFNVCFIRVDGSDHTCLDIMAIEQPSWSPNGEQLLYHSMRDENSGLYVTNLDGTNIRRLSSNSMTEWDRYASWSPDGKHIAFNPINGYAVYIMNPDGTDRKRLTGIACWFPAWSPDGKYIAMAGGAHTGNSYDCDENGIYLMNADGSNKILLTKLSNLHAQYLAWAPDGKHIIFSSHNDPPGGYSPNVDIYSIDVNGSNLTQLTYDGKGGSNLSWSPDSRYIAFEKYNYEEHRPQIYIMDADGSNIIILTEGQDPAWQP